jgi:hypothetical protein
VDGRIQLIQIPRLCGAAADGDDFGEKPSLAMVETRFFRDPAKARRDLGDLFALRAGRRERAADPTSLSRDATATTIPDRPP